MNNLIQITIKQWSVLVLFSLASLASSATAIIKTNSDIYNSTIGVVYANENISNLSSQGSLFYGMGEDMHYQHSALFTTKSKEDSDVSYTHDASTIALSRPDYQELYFNQSQGVVGDYYASNFAFENFNWDWNFEVLNDDALLNLVLLPGTGEAEFSLMNLTSSQVVTFNSVIVDDQINIGVEEYGISLNKGNNYLLSLNMTNKSNFDGYENVATLSLNNAIFPIPAPNNILILLIALVALIPLRRTLK